MPAWTAKREARCVRDSRGRFKKWTGGLSRAEDPRDSSRAGLYRHISADFRKLKGRAPRVGDIHRCVDSDGSYHAQAFWYVRTKNGWRRSPTEQRKPTKAQIRKVNDRSRPR
jgi:hypothetical protein